MDKGRIQQVVDALPQDVDVIALIATLYLLRRLEIAEEEIAAGKVLEHAEVKRRMAKWLK